MNWRHSIEMLMYGATVLTYCSLLYLKGYKDFAKIEPGVRQFMDEHGYETLADMRGLALKYIVTPGEVDYIPMLPEIDLEKCNGCGLCAAPGHCECIEIVDGKAVLVKSDRLLLVRRLLLPLRAGRHPHEGGADRGDAGRRGGRWSDDRPRGRSAADESLRVRAADVARRGLRRLGRRGRPGRRPPGRRHRPPRADEAGQAASRRRWSACGTCPVSPSCASRTTARLAIGAATPLAVVENSRDGAGAASRPSPKRPSCIGSVQVRSRATVGGNLCNAAPSADMAPILIAYGARGGHHRRPGRADAAPGGLLHRAGRDRPAAGELLEAVRVPPAPQRSYAKYYKTFRSAMDCCTVGVAVCAVFAPGLDAVGDVRLALGAVAPTPIRAREAERIADRAEARRCADRARRARRPPRRRGPSATCARRPTTARRSWRS